MLARATVASALLDASADAGLATGKLAVFIVDARRPPGTTPLAYLQPAGVVRSDTVAVFRAAGAGRVGALHLRAHRLALWRELPGIPPAALGPMLRHELEHARRFERSGPSFFGADDLLRAALGRAGGGYAALPSEREANAASAAYARARLGEAELEAVARCAECANLLGSGPPPPGDVVEETLALLRARPGEASPARLEAYLGEVRRACAAWARDGRLDLSRGRRAPLIELVPPDPAVARAVWGES